MAKKVQSPIKWGGGKRNQLQFIIPKILSKLKNSNHYFKPFVGGGSVIIELLKQCWMHKVYHVSFFCYDINPILISMFIAIKNNPQQLIEKLKQYNNKNDENSYYLIRQEYNQNLSVEKFIYLNKTGFRGLYSVN